MFSKEVVQTIEAEAARAGVEAAALLAVAEVETGGRAFVRVGGRDEPLIRFEGHYFDRRLSPDRRASARRAGLASPEPGGVANPPTQTGRWRLLERAAAIDRKAAWESTSWGLGQVMGAHWAWLGFADVDALVAEARGGVPGQVRLMTRYIGRAALAPALRAGDWAAFARGYNGPLYRRNAYHLKIAAAYERHSRAASSATEPTRPSAEAVLGRDERGAPVRELQLLLTALGYPLAADGVYGSRTEAAVRRFQRDNALRVDGLAGPRTMAAIAGALRKPVPGLWSRIRSFLARLALRG